MSDREKVTADDVLAALRAKYGDDDYAYLEQVPNGTGAHKSRTCDALAIGCWAKTHFELSGFEVKVSRSDWLKEIQDVSKSAVFQRHCHRWWIVASQGIVKLEELPAEWGLMEFANGGLKVRKPASLLTPVSVTFEFLAGILRKAKSESPSEARLAAERKLGAATERKRQESIPKQQSHESDDRELKQLLDSLAAFELASGVKIGRFNGENIGKKFVEFQRFSAHFDRWGSMTNAAKSAEEFAANARLLASVFADTTGKGNE